MATEEPRSPEPLGFYVRDTISSRMMLVNTGAIRSLFPLSREDCKRSQDPAAFLTAANGSPILFYGTSLLLISILGRRYSWNFVVADVGTPLLGVDFLAHFGLAVDIGCKRLLNIDSCQSLLLAMGPSAPTICSVAPHQYSQLLKEFPDVFRRAPSGTWGPSKTWHLPSHKDEGPPTHARFRRLPPRRLQEAKDAFTEMERMGICKKASSPLRNVGATFQRLMDSTLEDLKFCVCYVDDILIFSRAVQEFLGMDPTAPLQLTTDASSVACGAVLEQIIDGAPQPVVFFSKKFNPAETGYSTFDRELCAVYRAVWHFKFPLEGTPFTIYTDHQPLVHAFTKKNPVADTLSRVELNVVQLGINCGDLAWEQAASLETRAYCTAIRSPKWRDMALTPKGPKLLCDISTGQPCPLVLASRRCQVFDVIHGLSHPSGRMTTKLPMEKFIWHRIRKDARTWARQCLQCQTSKIGRHTESGIGEFPQPGWRFGHIHIDVVGPLPPSGGARYLLTIVNRSTRWPEATPMQEATASACTKALLSSWISLPWHACWGHLTTPPPTTPRANSDLYAVEKIYGEPLVVLGELVTEDCHNPSFQRLRDIVGKSVAFTPPCLSSTTHVFVRDDAVRPPLIRPYRGPFCVLERNNKAFWLALHGKDDWVSVDDIKPALLEEETDVTAPHPPPEPPFPQKGRRRRRT
ncbi:uncharacterized protein [Macrobrachium rosenbergii]|uniref:uncharacterized protein n=1 Tax=Macrobrachium rosenbergii TaxID=79674 RepID=UPI0034D7771B